MAPPSAPIVIMTMHPDDNLEPTTLNFRPQSRGENTNRMIETEDAAVLALGLGPGSTDTIEAGLARGALAHARAELRLGTELALARGIVNVIVTEIETKIGIGRRTNETKSPVDLTAVTRVHHIGTDGSVPEVEAGTERIPKKGTKPQETLTQRTRRKYLKWIRNPDTGTGIMMIDEKTRTGTETTGRGIAKRNPANVLEVGIEVMGITNEVVETTRKEATGMATIPTENPRVPDLPEDIQPDTRMRKLRPNGRDEWRGNVRRNDGANAENGHGNLDPTLYDNVRGAPESSQFTHNRAITNLPDG